MNMARKYLLSITLLLIFSCSGCRMTYLLHMGIGQLRFIHGSIPVKEALQKDALTSNQKDRLRLVGKIKRFGIDKLGLKNIDCYETVYLKAPQHHIYVISASPKDRLARITWWFPVVGRMPYLGFFDLEEARAERETLEKKRLDVSIGVADAYSTLGWFNDPVTLNMIRGSLVGQVETILHEMTHNTIYLKGQGEFNEGIAVLVGKVGAWMFLAETQGVSDPLTIEAEGSIEDERLFCRFLNGVLKGLEELYASQLGYEEKLKRREVIFSSSLETFRALKAQFRTRRFSRFGEAGLNNAYLMSVGLYHKHFLLFDALLKQYDSSIPRTLAFLTRLSKDGGDMIQKIRDWLENKSPHEI